MRFIVLAFVTLMTFISPASGTGFEQAVERYKAKEFQIAFAEFYELATEEHASAQVNLAIMFAKGQGVPQNDAHALYWAWRARFYHRLFAPQFQPVPHNNFDAAKSARCRA